MALLRTPSVFQGIMKIQDYEAILRAVERALEVCEQSTGFMDQMHREICDNLQSTRDLLVRIIGSKRPGTQSP